MLAGVIQVLGPILWMDQRPSERLFSREMGTVTLLIAIITRATMEEAALEYSFLLTGKPGGYTPAFSLTAPFDAYDPVFVPY
jgi:hypothetical protein